jgi:hypothetical protein
MNFITRILMAALVPILIGLVRPRHGGRFLAMLLVFALVTMAAMVGTAEIPFIQSVTMTAGSGSMTYSNGINNDAYSAFMIQGVVFGASASSTQTVDATTGVLTNRIGTKVVSATSRALLVTNDVWHFLDSKVLLGSSDTNTFNAYVIGVER